MSMPELGRSLFLIGAMPFVILGLAHAVATPRTPGIVGIMVSTVCFWVSWALFVIGG